MAFYSFYFKYFLDDKYHANHQISTKISISLIKIGHCILNVYKSENDEFKLLSIKANIRKLKINAKNEYILHCITNGQYINFLLQPTNLVI
jgi:hypothetical protein